MTYHDALMCQLLALISVVRTVRQRLGDVEGGVVRALRVPQLAVRRQNLVAVLRCLGTIETLHNTQPTIQVLLTRQEFSGALDLIATSQDILSNEVDCPSAFCSMRSAPCSLFFLLSALSALSALFALSALCSYSFHLQVVNIESLRHLPLQLSELEGVIGQILLADLQATVRAELGREVPQCRASQGELQEEGGVEEGGLGPVITALVRQRSYSFLEFLEEQAVIAVKGAIRSVVLGVLDPQSETTLTQLVADFALIATADGWGDLLDLLVGSLLVVVRRVHGLHLVVQGSLEQGEEERLEEGGAGGSQLARLKNTAREVMLNICDQVRSSWPGLSLAVSRCTRGLANC